MKLFCVFAVLVCFAAFTTADQCTTCKLLATTIKFELSRNSTQHAIEEKVLEVCKLLPSPISTECTSLVQAYFPTIIALVIKYDNPTVVCQELGLCPKEITKVGNFDECSICHFLVGIAEGYVESNATEQEIFAVFDKACAILPGAFKAVCVQVVETFGPSLIKALFNSENPDTVCKQLHICPATLMKAQGATECSLCKLLVGYAENYVKSNASEGEIIKAAEKLCSLLPSSVSGICKALVDSYIPQIINLLVNKVPPETICSSLGLCTSSFKTAVVSTGSAECTVCKLVVSYLENFVKSNSTETEIIKEAEKLCSILPASLSGVCKMFVDTYLPQVINLLVAKVPPETICSSIGLCTSKKVAIVGSKAGSTKIGASAIGCKVCQLVVATAENFLDTATTQTELLVLAEKVCAILPIDKTECKAIVDTAVPSLLQYVLTKETPSVACSQLKLCAANKDFLKMKITDN